MVKQSSIDPPIAVLLIWYIVPMLFLISAPVSQSLRRLSTFADTRSYQKYFNSKNWLFKLDEIDLNEKEINFFRSFSQR